jgi:hypothetical protein
LARLHQGVYQQFAFIIILVFLRFKGPDKLIAAEALQQLLFVHFSFHLVIACDVQNHLKVRRVFLRQFEHFHRRKQEFEFQVWHLAQFLE